MTVPAPRARRRPSTLGRLLPLLLIGALLAPLGLLVTSNWRQITADRDLAARERLGVQYLTALAAVTDALVEAQSNAVNGRPVAREALNGAVEEAAAVDARIGGELLSQERWAGVRAKLEALRGRSATDPEAAYTAYGEVSDLLLALHRKVRESSGLVRDPEADSFFLQDSVGQELPEAVVAAGRLADLGTLVSRRPAAEQPRGLMELTGLRVTALTPAADLVDNLRSAVDGSESTDLGANVLTPLDTYQRSVEALAAYSLPGKDTGVVNPGQLSAAALNSHRSARQLQPVILNELDALLVERIDRLNRDRWLTVGAAVAAALLLGWLTALLVAAGRRARRRAALAATHAESPDTPPHHDLWQPPVDEPRALQPAGAARDPETAPWGAFDAAR
ncbi:hypothetical protein ACLQ3D_18575 [Micromonospora vinacea]|uniref:Uncharacterized protein n=1 Tax=Micromonospora vinacea TaxID=709878 RepID=A0ABS0JYF0_9ACTN|nr:hypothetical protein [Micromonospora vinacea]MBG6100988.1 hypothetical protein [Micromonospora vinacea]WSZ76116.1 hypothetical protein OH804_30245 [Micromonospora sp. NBC_00860]WTA67397.1 hypothetical protein OHB51_34065 [Micromonospora sp. NBC_00855]